MDGASNTAAESHLVKNHRPAWSAPTTSYKPRATSLYPQKYRPADRPVPRHARARPGASSAFRKSDPDGPETSCSGELPHPSTRCATYLDRSTRKAEFLFRA